MYIKCNSTNEFCENYITAIKSLLLLFIFHVNEFSLNYSTIESYALWFYLKAFQIQIVTKQTKTDAFALLKWISFKCLSNRSFLVGLCGVVNLLMNRCVINFTFTWIQSLFYRIEANIVFSVCYIRKLFLFCSSLDIGCTLREWILKILEFFCVFVVFSNP